MSLLDKNDDGEQRRAHHRFIIRIHIGPTSFVATRLGHDRTVLMSDKKFVNNYRISYYFVHKRIEIWTFSDSILAPLFYRFYDFRKITKVHQLALYKVRNPISLIHLSLSLSPPLSVCLSVCLSLSLSLSVCSCVRQHSSDSCGLVSVMKFLHMKYLLDKKRTINFWT